MTGSSNLPRNLVLGFFAIGAIVAIYENFKPSDATTTLTVTDRSIVEPRLSTVALEGKALFNETCAACHGQNGAGTEQGPPFIHDIYNPGHHSDEAFFYAAQNGVRQHHWPFGNMPAQADVSREEVAKIVAYVRELQAANGIKTRPHNM